MKILIENYTDLLSTEPTYLNHAFSQAGVESHLWEPAGATVFDIFDRFHPDFYITHYNRIDEARIKRLSQSACKVILNVSGIQENEAKDLENTLKSNNINIAFCFYNFNKPVGFKCKTVQIMPGADIFLEGMAPSPRQIPTAFVSDELFDEKVFPKPGWGDVYHKIALADIDGVDARMSLIDLIRSSHVYTNVKLFGSNPALICGQAFFDLSIRLAGKCSIDINDENEKMVGEFMENLFPELPGTPEQIKNYITSTILAKHTCLNRAERLIQNIGNEEVANNLRAMQDQVRKS